MIQVQIDEGLKGYDGINHAVSELLEQAARLTILQLADQPQSDATLVLSDDEQLQTLNSTYLGIDAPTDVLAFPGGEADPETGVIYLGDVVISYPRAVSQAADGGHPIEAELQLLAVHGMLHLCGFDHANLQEKEKMWQIQAEILELLDCPIRGPAPETGS